MAHRRTYSARQLDMGKPSLESPPLTPALAVYNSFHLSNTPKSKTRQFWQRTTFLALFALVVISGYVFFIAQPSFASVGLQDGDISDGNSVSERLSRLSAQANRLGGFRHKSKPSLSTTKIPSVATSSEITLNPPQELAAITSFIASLPQNVIPPSVDPSLPIDPQLVLDFDTQSPRAVYELDALVNDTWVRYPVVLYGKLHSPVSREIKQLLLDMNLLPSPTIIEVDERSDQAVLTPLLYRLSSTTELPILLIGGHPIGSAPEIRYLYSKGELQTIIGKSGAKVDGGKKKKGRKH